MGGALESYYVSLCHMNSRGHVIVIFLQFRVGWDTLWNVLGSQSELSKNKKKNSFIATQRLV